MTIKREIATNTSEETLKLIIEAMGGRPKFGDLIKAVRSTQNITMEQLGAILGSSRQYVNNLEKGRDTTSLAKAIEIAESFGYNPKFFIEVWVDDQLERVNLNQYRTKIIDSAEKPRRHSARKQKI